MDKTLPELLAIGQQFYGSWLREVKRITALSCVDHSPYDQVLVDFTWIQEHMRAVVALFAIDSPYTTQPHLRLLKDEAYLHAAAASGTVKLEKLDERKKEWLKRSWSGVKRRMFEKAKDYMQPSSEAGELLKAWAQWFNADVHDHFSLSADYHFDEDIAADMVVGGALPVFWMHHRLLPCVQPGTIFQQQDVKPHPLGIVDEGGDPPERLGDDYAATWHELDQAYRGKMDEEWSALMTNHVADRLPFTPEETVYKA